MKLNESKFLEELNNINEKIKSAYQELGMPRVVHINSTAEQKAKDDELSEKIDSEFHKSIYEPIQKLSYLLSLVEVDPFEDMIREFYPLIKETLKEIAYPHPNFIPQPSPYPFIYKVPSTEPEETKKEEEKPSE